MSVCNRKNCIVENLPRRVKGTLDYYMTFAWVYILQVTISMVEQNLQAIRKRGSKVSN
jgi:hypothetical protein